ncbi:MAG: hypothetical protein FJ225_13610 [Lentisphaerae bacterium]|nr:hypothetical protein [Lentisphaerota bacterium]
MTTDQLQQRIRTLQTELAALGPIHPGSLSQQYNVCGNPACRCKDPKRPRKHGPYYQLSYTWRGKSTTRFVRPPDVAAMGAKLAAYKRFRQLTAAWVDAAIALQDLQRQAARPEA